jgi:transposase
MKPYSNDLRQKVVDAYKKGGGSMRKLARRFSVSLSVTVQRPLPQGTVERERFRLLREAQGRVAPDDVRQSQRPDKSKATTPAADRYR